MSYHGYTNTACVAQYEHCFKSLRLIDSRVEAVVRDGRHHFLVASYKTWLPLNIFLLLIIFHFFNKKMSPRDCYPVPYNTPSDFSLNNKFNGRVIKNVCHPVL